MINRFNIYSDLPEMPDMGNLTSEERECVSFISACYGCAAYVLAIMAALMICLLFGSCRTVHDVEYRDRHMTDTLIEVQHHRDSIYFADSIYVSDFMRGDTVWSIRDRWHTRYVEHTRTDTVYQSHRDTVTAVYENVVTKEVAKPLTAWQTFRLYLANIVLMLLAGGMAVWLWRLRK